MITISIEEAQARLSELIEALPPGEEASITRDGRAIARLVIERPAHGPRLPATAKAC